MSFWVQVRSLHTDGHLIDVLNFSPDWLRNVVSVALTRLKTHFSIMQGQITSVLLDGFRSLSKNSRSCAYKYFMQLWSRLIEKSGLYRAYKFKTAIFNNSRAITSVLPSDLIRDLVSINTLCNWQKCGLYRASKVKKQPFSIFQGQ